MATVSGSRPGAGGKIVTNRRRLRLAATPYDRPLQPPAPPKSPNWFTGVIIPSARALASSAGKILSSVIFSDPESSSSEDVDSASEDDIDYVNEYEIPNDGINASNEFSVRRTETKRLIEQLILQENFSREECDRLVKVLNSRVVDRSIEAWEKGSFANSPRQTIDHEDVDVFNKAVLEAQKWFQEKKERPSSVELAHGISNLKSTVFDHIESGVGSPVDMARSYMRNKPPWASPTIKNPSTTTMNLFKEGTPYSISHDVLSSSKRQDSLATGSWNIQEELRKVRSKAIDNMLRSPPSKIDSSLLAVASTREETAGTSKVVSDMGERIPEQHSFWKTKPLDTLMDVGMSFDPALIALESRQGGKATEALSSIPDASVSGNNEDSEAIQIDGENTPSNSKSLYLTSPNHAGEQHPDPHSSKIIGHPVTEVAEFGASLPINGFSSSQASLSSVEARVQNSKHYDEENHNDHIMSDIMPMDTINEEGELPSEAYLEIPVVTEINRVPSDSQISLDVQYTESPLEMTQSAEGKPDITTGKQPERKSGRINRRGRGRGK